MATSSALNAFAQPWQASHPTPTEAVTAIKISGIQQGKPHAANRTHGRVSTAAQCSINTFQVAASVNSPCSTGVISSPFIAAKISNSYAQNIHTRALLHYIRAPVWKANRQYCHACPHGPRAKPTASSMHATTAGAPTAHGPSTWRFLS